jgi:uncharacterized membrane protein YvlD (DUF360 family)
MIIGLIVNTIAFIIIAELLPGFRIRSHGSAILVAIAYACTYVLSWWLMAAGLVAMLAALFVAFPPAAFLAGFASLMALPILSFFVSILALTMADRLMDSFQMNSWGTTFLAALLLAFVNFISGAVFGI